jgi:hypothetical protein
MIGFMQLPFGRDGHRAGGRAHSRLRPLFGQDGGQFLDQRYPLYAYLLLPICIPYALFLVWQGSGASSGQILVARAKFLH